FHLLLGSCDSYFVITAKQRFSPDLKRPLSQQDGQCFLWPQLCQVILHSEWEFRWMHFLKTFIPKLNNRNMSFNFFLTATPVTATPVTASQVTATPVTATPVTATPVTATPVTATPVTETPVTATPVTATPVTATQVTATPVTATPVTATPVTATPVTATPVTATPVIFWLILRIL
uniref:Uncharacterized protein n=1 Tax=Pygocentrus nattereri TaxID=42514 RepID=A0AAR2KPJ7_PYGNA